MSLESTEKNYARSSDKGQLPSLIEVQIKSFDTFRQHGLEQLFREISPIKSYNESLLIYFPDGSEEAREFDLQFRFDPPKHSARSPSSIAKRGTRSPYPKFSSASSH